jgi:uncharacterized protein DUF5329
MKRPLAFLALFAITFSAVAAAAEKRPPEEQAKIDWLLSEIRNADAVFIRNGVEYNGEKAASHIKSKLFWAGKRVQTVEDFIVGVASKSETSGKPYEIRLKDGTQEPIQKWLRERLAIYEKGKSKV